MEIAKSVSLIYNGRNLSFDKKVLLSELYNEPRRGELYNELQKAIFIETQD